jgi:hypothetical protein
MTAKMKIIDSIVAFISIAAILTLMYFMFDGFFKQVPQPIKEVDTMLLKHDTILINYGLRLDSIDRFHNRIK